MGTGEAEGDNRSVRAAEAAISNPLLEDTNMAGARGLLINITGGEDMTLFEVDQAANRIREEVDEEANIIFGSAIDSSLNGRIRVSVVATGIDSAAMEYRPRLELATSNDRMVTPMVATQQHAASNATVMPVAAVAEIQMQATGTHGGAVSLAVAEREFLSLPTRLGRLCRSALPRRRRGLAASSRTLSARRIPVLA
jgi:cell division GTPase FtsZ